MTQPTPPEKSQRIYARPQTNGQRMTDEQIRAFAEQVWRSAMVAWGRDPDAATSRKDTDEGQREQPDHEKPRGAE